MNTSFTPRTLSAHTLDAADNGLTDIAQQMSQQSLRDLSADNGASATLRPMWLCMLDAKLRKAKSQHEHRMLKQRWAMHAFNAERVGECLVSVVNANTQEKLDQLRVQTTRIHSKTQSALARHQEEAMIEFFRQSDRCDALLQQEEFQKNPAMHKQMREHLMGNLESAFERVNRIFTLASEQVERSTSAALTGGMSHGAGGDRP